MERGNQCILTLWKNLLGLPFLISPSHLWLKVGGERKEHLQQQLSHFFLLFNTVIGGRKWRLYVLFLSFRKSKNRKKGERSVSSVDVREP